MVVRNLVCLVLIVSGYGAIAQTRPEKDTEPAPSTRTVSHYIGLQANQLIRQLISFGGNNSPINNPYILAYSMNSKSNGFGFSTGLGYSLTQSKTNDNFVSITSKVNDVAWRIGLDKKTYISRRWLAGFGFDVLLESNKSEVISKFGSGVPSQTVTTTQKRKGLGPRVFLNYQFSEKLMIGTEASFYLKFVDQETKATGNASIPDPKSSIKNHQFNVPAVLFLTMKF